MRFTSVPSAASSWKQASGVGRVIPPGGSRGFLGGGGGGRPPDGHAHNAFSKEFSGKNGGRQTLPPQDDGHIV